MKLIVHGARGSIPTCGAEFSEFGGNSTCFSLRTAEGTIVVDAGTGIQALSDSLKAKGACAGPITILFTHFHLDHVIGLPCFTPLYNAKSNITVMGDPREKHWPRALKTLFGVPYWPVELARAGARISLSNLPPQGRMRLYGANVSWIPLHHPQPCLAFRFESEGRAAVVATDHEHGDAEIDAGLLSFARNAGVLVYDAQYTPVEFRRRTGWGHSTWLAGARLAAAAGVGKLVLTHHDRRRTDEQVRLIVKKTRAVFPAAIAAREGMAIAV